MFPFSQGRKTGILPIGAHPVYSVNWVDLDRIKYLSRKPCLRLSGQMVLSYDLRSLQASTPAWVRSDRSMTNWEGKLTLFTGQNQSILTHFYVIWCFANINSICNASFPRLEQSVCFISFSSTICGFSSLLAEFPGN